MRGRGVNGHGSAQGAQRERVTIPHVVPGMEEPEDKSRSGDVEAWVTIALIDAVATVALCALYLWLSGVTR